MAGASPISAVENCDKLWADSEISERDRPNSGFACCNASKMRLMHASYLSSYLTKPPFQSASATEPTSLLTARNTSLRWDCITGLLRQKSAATSSMSSGTTTGLLTAKLATSAASQRLLTSRG